MASWKLSESDALKRVQSLVDLQGASSHRRPFERTALRNRLYYLGKHWFIEDRAGNFREPKNVPSSKSLYKANLVLGNVIRSILTVTGANGEFTVPPKKATRAAEKASWVSTKLFEHMSEIVKMRDKSMLACLMAAIDGAVIWKVSWDPDAGESSRFYYPENLGGLAAGDVSEWEKQRLEAEGRYKDMANGDVAVSLVSLFQFWWDWKGREGGVDECDRVAQADIVRRDSLREQYGSKVDDVPESDGRETNAGYWNELLSFMSGQFSAGVAPAMNETGDDADDWILRLEYWERPLPSNGGKGRYIVTAGNTVLENRDNKYRETQHPLPFVRQNWIDCPGRFWGVSLVENLTSAQRQYNVARSKVVQHQNAFGTPTSFYPKQWGVPAEQIQAEPGAWIPVENISSGDIKYGPAPSLPKEVAENAAAARSEMADISSQQSLESSKLPGQIRGSQGIELMLAERDKPLILPAENFLLSKAEVGRHMLDLASKRYPEDRILHYVGQDRKYRVLEFRRADIVTDLRVVVDRGKVLASPAAARARVLEMVQLEVLQPGINPDDREAVLRALEFQTADGIVSDRLQEEENQEREIQEMVGDPIAWLRERADSMAPMSAEGEPPATVQGYPTNPFDDDQAHVRVLLRFVRSQEYRDLDPLAQQLLVLHLQEHQGKIQQAMMQQMMMEQALSGGGSKKGEPSKARQPSIQ